MSTVEFEADVSNGVIEIPERYREHLQGTVRVFVAAADENEDDSWLASNNRRWELIEKKLHSPLSESEVAELAKLQQRAETELAGVGPRPLAELEQLESELSEMD